MKNLAIASCVVALAATAGIFFLPQGSLADKRAADTLKVAVQADLGHLVGTTGLFTTAPDLLVWEENFANVRVGDSALIKAMQAPNASIDGETSFYGFGLEVGEDAGLRTIGHGGGDPGYAAYVVRYPDQGIAVAVLCNMDNIGATVGALARSVAGIYLSNVAPARSASSATAIPHEVSLSAEQLVSRVGLYRNPSPETFGRLFIRDGHLKDCD